MGLIPISRRRDKKLEKQQRDLRAVIGDQELAAFPALVSDALRKISEPEFDLNQIADLLVRDPGVTMRLLGMVNSAALSRGRPITSVHQAVVILGRNQLESLLISLAVKGSLPSPTVAGFDGRRFWITAARRAAIAGQLASKTDPSRRSENFTAALLQDMALPVLAQRADGYSTTLQDWHESTSDLASLERSCHGWDHGEVGSLMATSWQFPSELVHFLDDHHSSPEPIDTLLPAKLVAPIRESDSSGDEQLIETASAVYPIPTDQLVDLIKAADEEANQLARLLV
ncbi:MAG: HDOD domain-containing protein [Acidimicrobiales bacterium]